MVLRFIYEITIFINRKKDDTILFEGNFIINKTILRSIEWQSLTFIIWFKKRSWQFQRSYVVNWIFKLWGNLKET